MILDRIRLGAIQGAGLGLLAGAMEAIHLATSLKLSLSPLRFALLGVVDVVVMGLVALVVGSITGLVHLAFAKDRDEESDPAIPLAWQVALCAFFLTGMALWQGAYWTATEGEQPVGAAAMAAMPLGFAGVVYFNARFWFRRLRMGLSTPRAWPTASLAGSLILVGIATVAYAQRDTGGAYGLDGDKNVVIVTVDGLGRGAVDAAATPALDALAADGLAFADAVTPTPGSRSANATVLVGLHPLRHKVMADSDVLSRAYRTVFEVLEAEGWATGGFVSSPIAAAGSGLDQGMRTYDDDFVPSMAGILRINAISHLFPWLDRDGRPASTTVDRFTVWARAHADRPFAAWIHLADPHAAEIQGADPGVAVAAIDAEIGRIRDLLDDLGVSDRTLLVVAGAHGELGGARGGSGNRTLHDEVIRVPLWILAPGDPPRIGTIAAQVRLMDLLNTTLQWIGLDRSDTSEGIDLMPYGTGARSKTIWCALVGQDLDGNWLLGMRNNGVKYIRDAAGAESLYILEADPGEETDRTSDQAATLSQARSLLASEVAAMEQLIWGR